MSEHIGINHNRQKNIPSDCIICAMRPALYLNQINIYQAEFFCYHSVPPSTPHFQPSKLLKIITMVLNFVLIFGIYNDLNQISGTFTSKQVLIFLEVVLNASTVIFNLIYTARNKIRLQESHGLIAILNNKTRFGFDTILTSRSSKKMHTFMFYSMIMFTTEELILLNVAFVVEDVDRILFVRIFVLEVLIVLNATLAFACVQIIFLYEGMFGRCYYETQRFLKDFDNHTSGTSFIRKVRKLQRFYMSVRRNFKLNEDFFEPGVFVIYSLFVCLLLIGYGYFAMTFALGDVDMLNFDIYLLIKSSAVAGAFGYLCYRAERVATMSEELLSFLFKYPISKLNHLESAQIEMLISTLVLQKPDLTASNILTIGTRLITSISGTVVTYVLAALQFRAIWLKK